MAGIQGIVASVGAMEQGRWILVTAGLGTAPQKRIKREARMTTRRVPPARNRPLQMFFRMVQNFVWYGISYGTEFRMATPSLRP
jgi:hypothetical protein